ncbi:uncharacterized protein LOC124871427 [Girardinichthys multiradiatus]|uniref:uncharacterized protein LOC124871427 n=1 Tax=Girardinichthys multiradiatus TaxID=208333 RepID=UPI001FACEA6C|nr:uncharacterized protein LOC124871427 [Girardinichthys multiradiatus]
MLIRIYLIQVESSWRSAVRKKFEESRGIPASSCASSSSFSSSSPLTAAANENARGPQRTLTIKTGTSSATTFKADIVFQCVSRCLMVTMLSLKQAALFFIQLLNTSSVFAGTFIAYHWDVSVSRGDLIQLTCNISNNNTKMIQWTKDRYYFSHSYSSNRTFSNFSSNSLRIDLKVPSTFNISNAQHDDAGLYTCIITDSNGFNNMTWNVTVKVFENQKEISLLLYITFTLLPAFGLILCCTALAVCLWRKCGSIKENQKPVQNQSLPQSGQSVPAQMQLGTGQWRNKRQRKEYIERLNSVYGEL